MTDFQSYIAKRISSIKDLKDDLLYFAREPHNLTNDELYNLGTYEGQIRILYELNDELEERIDSEGGGIG